MGMPQTNEAGAEAGALMPPISTIFFPQLSWTKFIGIISIILYLCFIGELLVGAIMFDGAFVADNQMGGPSGRTFMFVGAKDRSKIVDENQYWRLITPIFLHAGIIHIAYNTFFTMHVGFKYEALWGTWRMVIFYFVSGIGGNLLSCLCSPGLGVGASGAIFGILGGQIGWLFMNWSYLKMNPMPVPDIIVQPEQEACNLIFMIVLNFMFSIGMESNIDNWAHAGGLISGIFIGTAFPAMSDPLLGMIPGMPTDSQNNVWKSAATGITAVWYGTLLVFLMTGETW